MTVRTVYKLVASSEWDAAWAEGVYRGSAQDQKDGYIHLSSAAQIAGTARKYFEGVSDLVLLAIDVEMLEKLHAPNNESLTPGKENSAVALRWEPSRGGELFPHLYALLPAAAVTGVTPAPLADDGTPIIPGGLPS